MIRSHRTLAWSLILALLCATLATLQPLPVALAAVNTYYVDTALDDNLASNTNACPSNNSAADDDCTFRQAIEKANADNTTSEIRFVIPADADPNHGYNSTTNNWTIRPNAPLTALSAGGTTITGRNDNPEGTPRIILDGTNVPSSSGVGITISSANNVLTQMIIINFNGTSITSGIGVRITGAGANTNQIYGNYIGNQPRDISAHPNRRAGIQLDTGAHDNTIGLGNSPGQRNVISGNGSNASGDGIVLQGAASNLIQGNYIGLGLDATLSPVKLANAGYGIQIADGSTNTVGGSDPTLLNVISGNGQSGVILTGTGATGNQVIGNFIGTDVFGTSDLGNGEDGVQIFNGAKNNTISSSVGSRSVISGNAGYGVLISDSGTTGNKVAGAFIGVTVGGGLALPNDAGGVRVQNDASNNTIGGGSSSGNVISGNTGYGVSLGRTTTGFTNIFSNTISANVIGLNSAATQPVSNTLGGVLISTGSKSNRVGGSSAAEQNVISGNGGPGITVSGPAGVANTTTLSNTISANLIGLRRSSVGGPISTAGGNAGDGVLINGGAQGTRVGGTAAEANTIGGNTGNGVHVSGTGSDKTTIQSNYIGVFFANTTYTAVGNTLNGVLVDGGAQRATILDNHISRNGGEGIALDPQTAGAPGVPANANHDIDAPFGIRVNQNGQLTGRVLADGSSAACAAPCTVQIFTTDPAALDGQGRDKITPTFQLTSNGYFTATLSGQLPAQLALTATDKDGNTSEFAPFTRTFGLDIGPAYSTSALPSQVITYTHRLTNTGTVDFTNIQLGVTFTTTYNGVVSQQAWPYKLLPANTPPITLLAGQSKPVTLTLTLPAGSAPSVRAGLIQQTRITASASTGTPAVVTTANVTDTTTVGSSFVLSATPLTSSGVGAPGSANSIVRYVHTLTNNGNVAGTVQVSAVNNRGWQTTVSTDTVQLAPSESKNVTISVAIPDGTAPTTPTTPATTTVSLNVIGTPSQNKTLTDTTTVESTPSALLIHAGPADGEAGAGERISFLYTVENRSTGTETYSLSGLPVYSNSLVTFRRLDGQAFGPGNSFTLGTTPGTNTLNFLVEVRVDPRLLLGNVETLTVLLLDNKGGTRAAAQDRITVTRPTFAPRLYLPLVVQAVAAQGGRP